MNWNEFLAQQGARDDNEHFGALQAELAAARDATIVAPLTDQGLIRASGEDAANFLHNLLTNDINHLADGKAQHAGWCTAKGRMQASFVVWHSAGRYDMVLAADLLEATRKRLQMFVLRDKVKLAAGDDTVLLGLAGAQAGEALGDAGLALPEAPLAIAVSGDITVLQIEPQRYILAAPLSAAPALWQKLGGKARPAGVPAWRWLDVQAAFPLVTLATKEEFVPQMADFEKIGGVSFHKGCYPGQEVVARTQYLGKVKRHLYRLSADVPLKAGDDLFSPDNLEQAAGKVMSAAPSATGGHVALAVVQSNFAANLRLGSREGAPVSAVAVNPA